MYVGNLMQPLCFCKPQQIVARKKIFVKLFGWESGSGNGTADIWYGNFQTDYFYNDDI
jgi:hypothetical protein